MKEPEELTEKEEMLMERLLKNQKKFKWVSWLVNTILILYIAMDFFIAFKLAKKAGIESMWVTALGRNYETTEMYSGAEFLITKHFIRGLYLSLLIVGALLFSFLIGRTQKTAIKLWKIVKSNELAPKDGGSDDKGSDTGGSDDRGSDTGGSEGGEREVTEVGVTEDK